MRVHEHGLPQLVGCPGELAEQQDPFVVEPRGDVLLGDEVHAVAERRHEHHVGGEVEGDHLLARVSVMQVRDRLVVERRVVAVQAADGELDLVAQLPVGLDALARGTRDLHEGDVLDIHASIAQQFAVRLQAVTDALGVVQPVDAEHDRLGVAEALADLDCAGLHLGSAGDLLEPGCVDRDREMPGDDATTAAARSWYIDDRAVGRVPEQASHGPREVPGVGGALEADDVGAEQPVQDLPPPGQLRVDAVRRERDVIEEPDDQVGSALAEHPRHELQLVVVYPHHGAVGCRARGRLGESTVDPHVRLPPFAVERRRRDDVVVERPERVVRETLVVLLELRLRERHRDDRDAAVLERLELAIGDARPADPRAVGGAHHGLEGGDEAAGRALPVGLAVGTLLVVHREPVGDHDHLVDVVDVELVAFRVGAHVSDVPPRTLFRLTGGPSAFRVGG